MGVVTPESRDMGIIAIKQYTITCCILADTAEIDKPIPTQLNKNTNSTKYRVKREPTTLISNQTHIIIKAKVACIKPMRMGGIALPMRIMEGSIGVTKS